jgi:hypothetical protein
MAQRVTPTRLSFYEQTIARVFLTATKGPLASFL